MRDAGEPGIKGVTLELWLDVDGDGVITPGVDNRVRTTLTGPTGEYTFNALPEGSYLVDLTDDAGVLVGLAGTFGIPGVDDNGQSEPYPVGLTSANPSDFTADFAYKALDPNANTCFAFADGGDTLFGFGKDGSSISTIGGAGVPDIEAIAYRPRTDQLFAADADTLGLLDTATGAFTPVAGTFGTCTLPGGATVAVTDVDGLSFDPFNDVLWAANRTGGGPDVLLQIDPGTGLVVTSGTGLPGGASCVEIAGASDDIDDIAIDPLSGVLYGPPPGAALPIW